MRWTAPALASVVVLVPRGRHRCGQQQVGRGRTSGSIRAAAKRVCTSSLTKWANCGAQVVANANGAPLAGSTPPDRARPRGASQRVQPADDGPDRKHDRDRRRLDHPSIEADLAAYNAQYGLPSCTTANGCFRKVNQVGGTSPPATNSGWALEIALDVETAHAVCQNCKILLVEASSAATSDLGKAENEAIVLGASAISNSWGAREYLGETTDEVNYFRHRALRSRLPPVTTATGPSSPPPRAM